MNAVALLREHWLSFGSDALIGLRRGLDLPLLVADAVLNGAAGLNIWSMGGVSRPQRSARLYRALVDKCQAS